MLSTRRDLRSNSKRSFSTERRALHQVQRRKSKLKNRKRTTKRLEMIRAMIARLTKLK